MTTSATPNAAKRPATSGRSRVFYALVGVGLAVVIGLALVLTTRSSTPAVPASFDNSFDRAVPAAIAHLSLVDEHGHTTDLAAFRGRVVVLADFLTSCQDECPISTGAFLAVQRELQRDGLTSKVVIIEVTVDPRRDSVARLAAYERYTGVDWTLLTGTAQHIQAFWNYFGASYTTVKDSPSDSGAIDWQTGKQYTYDVDHSNNVYILDTRGHQRLLTAGLPSIGTSLPASLHSLLSPLGVNHLQHPGFGAWTEADLRAAIGNVLGTAVAAG